MQKQVKGRFKKGRDPRRHELTDWQRQKGGLRARWSKITAWGAYQDGTIDRKEYLRICRALSDE